MKVTTNTLNVLKNFAKINPSIVVSEGRKLKTISPLKTIMANAEVDTDFPQRFAIYNLDRFLSTASLFKDPDFEFGTKSVTITDGPSKTVYVYASEDTIARPPDREIKLPSVDVSFTLTNEAFREVERAAGVLGLSEIMVVGVDGVVSLQTADTKNPSGDTYSIVIGESDKTFRAIFKFENIKVMAGDYDVSISAKGISRFVSNNLPNSVEYFIAVEATSTF